MLMTEQRTPTPTPSIRREYERAAGDGIKHICPSVAQKNKAALEEYYPDVVFEIKQEEAFGKYQTVHRLTVKSTPIEK